LGANVWRTCAIPALGREKASVTHESEAKPCVWYSLTEKRFHWRKGLHRKGTRHMEG
jgi:hypothetical protein